MPQNLIELTNQRDDDANEDTDISLRAARFAAAQVESVVGDAGDYDDSDETAGDSILSSIGSDLALLKLYQYAGNWTPDRAERETSLIEQLENLNTSRIQAVAPVVKTPDNDDLNIRHPHSEWSSDDSDS